MADTDDDYKSLVLIAMATIIRLLCRNYNDDGRDAIQLAVEMERKASALQDKGCAEDDRGGGAG